MTKTSSLKESYKKAYSLLRLENFQSRILNSDRAPIKLLKYVSDVNWVNVEEELYKLPPAAVGAAYMTWGQAGRPVKFVRTGWGYFKGTWVIESAAWKDHIARKKAKVKWT